jgi:hypothetical protein
VLQVPREICEARHARRACSDISACHVQEEAFDWLIGALVDQFERRAGGNRASTWTH